jgi:hypothetical protein
MMRKTTLIFPDTDSLASFVLRFKIAGSEVDSVQHTLTAVLSMDELITACTEYQAEVKPKNPLAFW